MTVYTPTYMVAKNGVGFTNLTIDTVDITHGRQDVQDQPFPASMNLRFFSSAGVNLNFKLDDQIEFFIDSQRQFVGYVTQIDISMTPGSNNSNIAYYDVACAGPLAFLSRTNASALALLEEGESTRIANLIFRAFSLLWQNLGNVNLPNETWSQYSQTTTWNGLLPKYPFATNPSISASAYTLSAAAASFTDTLTICQQAASSGRGILYDTTDGSITYDNYFVRLNPSNTITINSDMVLIDSVISTLNSGDLVNVVTVEYTGGTETATNQPSIAIYGPRAATKTTTLEFYADAAAQAGDYVISRAIPQYFIKSFTIPLHIDQINAVDRGDLLFLDLDTALIWPANLLPEPLAQYTDTIYYVEGWNLRANRTSIYLTINQSPRSYTYGHKMWLETNLLTTWNVFDVNTQWKDA